MNKPEMIPVSSSQIEAIGHDPVTNQVHVKFASGGHYHYDNFTAEKFAEWKAAPSIGSWFYKNLKPANGSHPFTRHPDEA